MLLQNLRVGDTLVVGPITLTVTHRTGPYTRVAINTDHGEKITVIKREEMRENKQGKNTCAQIESSQELR